MAQNGTLFGEIPLVGVVEWVGRERGCPAVSGKPRQERLSEIEDGVASGAEHVRESGSSAPVASKQRARMRPLGQAIDGPFKPHPRRLRDAL